MNKNDITPLPDQGVAVRGAAGEAAGAADAGDRGLRLEHGSRHRRRADGEDQGRRHGQDPLCVAGRNRKRQEALLPVQGPTFLIEYDNTQNNGNHMHSVWRDFNGDFGRDITARAPESRSRISFTVFIHSTYQRRTRLPRQIGPSSHVAPLRVLVEVAQRRHHLVEHRQRLIVTFEVASRSRTRRAARSRRGCDTRGGTATGMPFSAASAWPFTGVALA